MEVVDEEDPAVDRENDDGDGDIEGSELMLVNGWEGRTGNGWNWEEPKDIPTKISQNANEHQDDYKILKIIFQISLIFQRFFLTWCLSAGI